MGRMLGVDFGLRRVGLALSDEDRILATPLMVAHVQSTKDAVTAVATQAKEHGVDEIVLGLPLNMNGTEGPLAEQVRAFSEALAECVTVPIRLWDERLTSKSAEDVLILAGTRRKRRKEVIDKLAAQIMLQHFLDAQSGGVSYE